MQWRWQHWTVSQIKRARKLLQQSCEAAHGSRLRRSQAAVSMRYLCVHATLQEACRLHDPTLPLDTSLMAQATPHLLLLPFGSLLGCLGF
jgi:hypothetical protein